MNFWAALTAWTEGSKARSVTNWINRRHQKRRFHGLLDAGDLIGVEKAKISWASREGEEIVRRQGTTIFVNVSSLTAADARDVIAQLRIEGLDVETEAKESST